MLAPGMGMERRRTDSLRCVSTRQNEHKGLIVGAAGMMVAGVLTANLSPLLAVSFADSLGFGVERAGVLISAGQGGVALSVLAMVPLLPRLDRRIVGAVGACVAAACLALTGFTTTFAVVLGLQIVMGLGAGLSFASANSALAYSRLPERAFSIVTITWMVVGSALLALGPTLHDIWPEAGVYLGIAAAELLCVVFISRLPDVRRLPSARESADDAVSRSEQSAGRVSRGWLTAALSFVGAIALIFIANAIIWTYAQSIGVHAGLSAHSVGTLLGVSQLTGVIGTGITLFFGATANKMRLIVPAGIALAVGGLLVGISATPAPYIAGLVAMFVAFYCLVPLLLALAAEMDTNSGRFVVLISAVTLIAGGSSPALGGWIVGPGHDWTRLGVVSFVLLSAAVPMLLPPVRAARRAAMLTRSE